MRRKAVPEGSRSYGSHAHYVPTGHLVYGVAGTLRAVPFDLARLEVVGTPAPVLEGVATTPGGAADIAVAANGSLVYVPGTAGGGRRHIVSADRQGRASPLPGIPPDTYRDVVVSPDGTRLALATQTDVWTYDVMRATLSRLTTDTALDTSPFWTPDGQRIIFTSNRAGNRELFSRAADGTGSDERLLARAKDLLDLRGSGWSADGRQFLFTEVSATVQCAIGQIAIERPSEAKVLVTSEFCDDFCVRISRWTMDGVRVERVQSIRDLRRAVSRAWESAADLDWRWLHPPLVARRPGTLFCQPGQSADACGFGAVRDNARRGASAVFVRIRDAPLYCWAAALRPGPRWPVLPHPQRPGGDRRRRAVEHDPGGALVRRAEAARTGELSHEGHERSRSARRCQLAP
jgi:hypothetical protein